MPEKTADRAVLLTPGASAGRDQPALVAVEKALSPVPVDRMDFPYRRAGRKSPDKAPVLVEAVRQGAADLAKRTGLPPGRLVLGGRSMGGRMCSMAVAEGLAALGLALVSYPLHPPGKPESSRIEHLPKLDLPCLFVSGTRDAFGTVEELEAATATIPGEVTHVWLDGGDHGLRRRDDEVAVIVRDWVASL
ncbi:MAG: dienelactone hydrolase [Acidimicrobiia bacterium]|nr:dienelactone hydrolase [Acidimicrobiia bacterium]